MSQHITTALLEDTDEEDALFLIASSVRRVAEADAALIVLPNLAGRFICEIAEGRDAGIMIGLEFPPEGRAQSAIRSGKGMIVPSMERVTSLRVPELSRFGPALYAPMTEHSNVSGVIILFRNPGRAEFTEPDLHAAQELAAQASLALRLSGIRLAEDRANLLEERNRIARDLHDLAIQQLFATSLQLTNLKEDLREHHLLDENISNGVNNALTSVADSISQIRTIVSELKDCETPNRDLVEGLRNECSMSRRTLGFAPSLLLTVNNVDVTSGNLEVLSQTIHDYLDESEIADTLAIVRESLTNVARHARATQVTVAANLWSETKLIPPQCKQIRPHAPLRGEPKGLLKVTITDDGCGIGNTVGRHSGLANIAARASVHFGEMQVHQRKDGVSGTELIWCIPLSF